MKRVPTVALAVLLAGSAAVAAAALDSARSGPSDSRTAGAQSNATDREAVRQAARDYVEGIYNTEPERLELILNIVWQDIK